MSSSTASLLPTLLRLQSELNNYRTEKSPVVIDGYHLDLSAVIAVARYCAPVKLDDTHEVIERVRKSNDLVENTVRSGGRVYGVNTGIGGSADTRTDQPLLLGQAVRQTMQCGILPIQGNSSGEVLPTLDPLAFTTMPESWVRAAILIRLNTLARGHAAVCWELLERLQLLLEHNITPMVPLRGSISASGDLSPLSYVAGTLTGKSSVRVFHGSSREAISSRKALESLNIPPTSLDSKETLAVVNGTSFSAAVASLVLHDASFLVLLTCICTAMSVEAYRGARGSFDPFIGIAAPHPGQVEASKIIWDLLEDSQLALTQSKDKAVVGDISSLKPDRYPTKTAPQFIGPQIEDLLSAMTAVSREINSSSNNPLADGESGQIHNGGNFQAMIVTNAMEKTRLSLYHCGKLLFAQLTELVNPQMNNGLPGSLTATDAPLNFHAKAIDVAVASYTSELGHLANPVSTQIQSTEGHVQSVNSLALVAARAALNSVGILMQLIASHIYCLCQALDLRALQIEFEEGCLEIIDDELQSIVALTKEADTGILKTQLHRTLVQSYQSSALNGLERMRTAASSTSSLLINYLASNSLSVVAEIPKLQDKMALQMDSLLQSLRSDYLLGKRGPSPASRFLRKTKPIYDYVRLTLDIPMHGAENLRSFENDSGLDELTIGEHVSRIYEAIRDGKMQQAVLGIFEE